MSSTGDAAVVWSELPRNGASGLSGAYIRFYAPGGSPRGDQQVLYYPAAGAYYSDVDVGIDDTGTSTAVWIQESGIDVSFTRIQYRRYSKDGMSLGPEISVDLGKSYASGIKIAVSPNGQALVVWTNSGTSAHISAVRIQADGAVTTAPFDVAVLAPADGISYSSVAMNADGTAIVAWGVDGNIFSRTISANGAMGAIVQVNQTAAVYRPDVDIDASGRYTVTWTGDSSNHIMRRRYSPNGTPLEDEFEVYAGSSRNPSIGLDNDGDAVIAWEAGNYARCFAQYFDQDGAPSAAGIVVAESSTQVVDSPEVAVDSDGDPVFVWQYTLLDGGSGQREGYFRRAVGPESVDLRMTVSDDLVESLGGNSSSYLVSVRNAHPVSSSGVGQAAGVVANVMLPDGHSLFSSQTTGWQCSGTQEITCSLSEPLSAGASQQLTFDVIRPDLACDNVEMSAVVDSDQYETDTANNGAADSTLVAKPGLVEFARPTQTASEATSPLMIDLVRSNGCLGGVSVTYSSKGIDATPGIDFSGSGTVTFASGVMQLAIPVQIINDSETEQPETFSVALESTSNGAEIGSQDGINVQIADDDGGSSGGGAFPIGSLLMLLAAALRPKHRKGPLN
ncbi:Calx-beta domain-containing protein [Sinimarinibacterium sp. CAU 1509]|uniref:Calx-beta domain-containing protein n=1 Tax=Sinimarinibacterium sp. CAU 1509 TaxID=2562283 RepID=UPI00146ABBD7|nr:Calx-beta domain-containing protein [Sinimarinibacterium sp. CAU 1509]